MARKESTPIIDSTAKSIRYRNFYDALKLPKTNPGAPIVKSHHFFRNIRTTVNIIHVILDK